jgi:6-phosphogluconolactonase (cycloisomerase 2 family)
MLLGKRTSVRFFIAIDRGSSALRPLLGQPFAAGENPRGLAIDRRGRFLYCTNYRSNSVSAYGIDRVTGRLTQSQDRPAVLATDFLVLRYFEPHCV